MPTSSNQDPSWSPTRRQRNAALPVIELFHKLFVWNRKEGLPSVITRSADWEPCRPAAVYMVSERAKAWAMLVKPFFCTIPSRALFGFFIVDFMVSISFLQPSLHGLHCFWCSPPGSAVGVFARHAVALGASGMNILTNSKNNLKTKPGSSKNNRKRAQRKR